MGTANSRAKTVKKSPTPARRTKSPMNTKKSPLNKSLTLTGNKLTNETPSGSEIGLYRAKALDLY